MPDGRMAEAYTCSGSCTTKITDHPFSYDPRGQMNLYYQASPNSNGYDVLNATYWEDEGLKTVSGVGLPAITYGSLDTGLIIIFRHLKLLLKAL